MLNLVIIDDEQYVIEDITRKILNFAAKNLRIVGVARNGVEGIELVRELKPDMILCDVKMPVMNGLEMVRKLREDGVKTKVVFISSVDDFDKVKAAINLNAQNFLLKPVDPQELEQTLQRLVSHIERKKQMQKQMEASMPILTQSFIQRLLKKSYKTDKEILSAIEFFNLPLQPGDFMVLFMKIDDYNNKTYDQEVMEQELCKYGIFNISMELLSNEYIAVGYYSSSDEIIIIVNSTDSSRSNVTLVYDICHDICHNVQRHLKTTVTIGAGRFYNGFGKIAKSYGEAAAAVECRHILGRNRIIPIQEVNLSSEGGEESFDMNEVENKLVSELKLGLLEGAKTHLEDIRYHLLHRGRVVSLEEIRITAMGILVTVLRELSNWYGDQSDRFQKKLFDYSGEIFRLNTIQEIFTLLTRFLEEMAGIINENRDNQQKKIIEQAVRIIEEHYADENLSLQEVAKQVHISSSYLSTMFKKEKNENFIDFLTRIRMQKAQELLRNTTMKAYEVARVVGYGNPQYFSLCFKKHTGYSPLQFKNV